MSSTESEEGPVEVTTPIPPQPEGEVPDADPPLVIADPDTEPDIESSVDPGTEDPGEPDPGSVGVTRVAVGPGRPVELDNVFSYHRPVADQAQRYEEIRAAGKEFAEVIANLVPSCSERSTAIAKIREAVMWSNAGIACNESQDEQDEEQP